MAVLINDRDGRTQGFEARADLKGADAASRRVQWVLFQVDETPPALGPGEGVGPEAIDRGIERLEPSRVGCAPVRPLTLAEQQEPLGPMGALGAGVAALRLTMAPRGAREPNRATRPPTGETGSARARM